MVDSAHLESNFSLQKYIIKKKTCFLENIAHRLPHVLPVFQAIGECHAKKTACILR